MHYPSPVSLVLGLAEVKPKRVGRSRWPRVSSDQFAGGSEEQRTERVAGKAGQVQNCGPVRKQERRLLRLLERRPERTLFRDQEQPLLQTQARRPNTERPEVAAFSGRACFDGLCPRSLGL